MKLVDTIIISLAVGLCLIGFHQTFKNGFFNNYWIFMLTIILLSIFQLRRKNREQKERENEKTLPKKKRSKNK